MATHEFKVQVAFPLGARVAHRLTPTQEGIVVRYIISLSGGLHYGVAWGHLVGEWKDHAEAELFELGGERQYIGFRPQVNPPPRGE